MGERYYLVREKAVPEVLLKVLEAKRLIKSEKMTVQEAAKSVGISRSSFYKYQEDIMPFHENAKGTTITFVLQMDDEPGLLSEVLRIIAERHGNILTINQAIPLGNVATLTLSVEIAPETGDVESMLGGIERLPGVHDLKISGRE
ncbi:MAG: ACT domain-containing protein [Eubacterium sp.]|nr:ACT domain-containing protein [Eubacterium sp.]